MIRLKNLIAILVCLVTFTSVAQENVLLERSFWNGNPNLAMVKEKVAEGNDPTEFNDRMFDPVVWAILGDTDNQVIAYLLSIEGNPVDKITHDGRTYLHWAASAGNTAIMKMLLENGASATLLGSHGYTPLTYAARLGQMNTEVYDLLTSNGADILSEENKEGANALLLISSFLQNEKDLAYFTDKGLDINSTDDNGNGIFNYATKKGNIAFLKLLVEKGMDYKTLNNNGGNAFLFAAEGARGFSNSLAIYKYLKSLGLKPNIVTKDGFTPLHSLASSNTDPEIFNFFFSEGADVNQKDSNGNTPFLNAAAGNSLKMVQLLSKDVKNFNTSNKDGQTALMLAVAKNSPEVVTYLVQKKAASSANISDTKDAQGNSLAYYLATSFDSGKQADFEQKWKLLQKKGLQLNTVQAQGNTLYHLAANANDLELLKRLSEYDIPVNITNDDGMTALHIAAMRAENDEMMKYLVAQGANTKIKTDFEETAYDLASENELLQDQNVRLQFLN